MRYKQRHVHRTIFDYISTGLSERGWFGTLIPAAGPNFGATQPTMLDYEPQQAGETPAPNTVAVSIEHQGNDDDWELGGLQVVEYTLFIDIYGENEPISISLADDVKDLLSGHAMPVTDYVTGEPSDLWVDFDHILVDKIPSTTLDKRSWRAVKATASCYF